MPQPLEPDEFQCDLCHGVFVKETPDEQEAAETAANWGDISDEDRAVICDPCWVRFKEWYRATYGRDLVG